MADTTIDPEQLTRWRLILGKDSQECLGSMGARCLSAHQQQMDQALATIYDESGEDSEQQERSAGLGGLGAAAGQSGWGTFATTSRKMSTPSFRTTPSNGAG